MLKLGVQKNLKKEKVLAVGPVQDHFMHRTLTLGSQC